ncbi:MAG: type IV pilus modification protein PilV [Pseudomonadales bacterium]|nr:type IV pilus modification protein PilV [Pseudomonadales bacterium]
MSMKIRSAVYQRGMNLIEVLITILVLSVGLMGMAAIQLTGLKSNQSAYFRSQASMLAYDMADRMRANATLAYVSTGNDFDTDGSVPSLPSCVQAATGCTAVDQVDADLAEWSSRVKTGNNSSSLLPGARGVISVDANNIFTITITWAETDWQDTKIRAVIDKDFAVNFAL